jgi:hypothetical protein
MGKSERRNSAFGLAQQMVARPKRFGREITMSNWLDYEVDVLASDPHEINQIAERLKRPSSELVNWIAEQFGRSLSEDIEGLRELVQFEAVQNLGYVHPSVNKARRFRLSFKDRFTAL